MSNGVYYTLKRCWNCGNQLRLEIPLGITSEKFMDQEKCKVCECNMRARKKWRGHRK